MYFIQDENNLLKHEIQAIRDERDELASGNLSGREMETQISLPRFVTCNNYIIEERENYALNAIDFVIWSRCLNQINEGINIENICI